MNSVRILAVDDDENQLAAVKRILRRSHFDVATCANPRQGLQLALGESPDLILLDVCMPGLSGHEFLRRLRKAEEAGGREFRIPVIFLSGQGASHQRVSGLDAGAEDYITKPFDAEELRARIRKQLRRDRQPVNPQTPAMSGPDLAQLESLVSGLHEELRGCRAPMMDLESNLDLAALVRQPRLQTALLLQAKKDMRKVADTLTRLAQMPAAQGDVK